MAVVSPAGGASQPAEAAAAGSAVEAAPAGAGGPDATSAGFSEGPSPGGRLRFILRSALPHLPQRDLTDIAQLFDLPEGQRLVILAGTEQHLAGADRFRLGLESIHPGRSGILDAYATARDRPKPAMARAGDR